MVEDPRGIKSPRQLDVQAVSPQKDPLTLCRTLFIGLLLFGGSGLGLVNVDVEVAVVASGRDPYA